MLPSGGFFVKHALRLSRASAALAALGAFVFGAASAGPALAQTLSPTPDTAIFQITASFVPATPTPTPSTTPTPTVSPSPVQRDSFAGDTSGSGRFVVIESSGDIATDRTPSRNNADGNQEIFLFDYAQRRIFQITNTTSVLKDAAKSSIDPTNIDIQVVNLQPVISHDGKYIVFLSNAYNNDDSSQNPKNFVGANNAAALRLDGNTEVFIYRIPDSPDVDLSQGTEVAPVDLAANTPQRLTTTAATAVPRPAATNVPAFFARDNDAPAVNDDGTLVSFYSMARAGIPGASNADGNKEIFVVRINRSVSPETRTFVQVTNTANVPVAGSPLGRLVFNINPSLSACAGGLACRVTFLSNAVLVAGETEANQGNGEVYVADIDASSGAASNLRQVTKTPPETRAGVEFASVNIFSPGRRMSRDGSRIAFESTAVFNANGTLNGALATSTGVYIANVAGGGDATFEQVSVRPPADQSDIGQRWPTFTGDSTRVVWASNLNLKPDGTVATTASEGINQQNRAQVFSAPVGALTTVSRVTNLLTGPFSALQPFPADTVRRVALTVCTAQCDGIGDPVNESFYQLIPVATSETPAPSPTPATSPAPVSFFTGATARAVVSATPAPTPPDVTGLAPGMLGQARSTLTLSPATREVDKNNAHETQRRPPLPVELSGVTVSISGVAAGLYFVAPNQINFVVPASLAASATAAPVVIFNNGALVRTAVVLNQAQPDIFTSTNGAGGRAAALNVTNTCVSPPGEPFTVTSTRPKGNVCTSSETETVPTQLLFMVTGMRGLTTANGVTVRIGTTDIVGTGDLNTSPVKVSASNTPGFDQVTVTLPASLAGAGDVPVIITVTLGGTTFTSRPADTAPRITIL
jgi:uncharacterized protein (TIGR03437 family)